MAEKKNPFAKLADEQGVSETKKKLAKAARTEAQEAEVVEAAKERVAAKRQARAKAEEPAKEPETEEVEEQEDGDADTEEVAEADGGAESDAEGDTTPAVLAADPAEAEKPAPVKKSSGRRTAAQADAEAQEREAALQAQIDELKAQMQSKADAGDIGIVPDRIVLEAEEGQEGGALRVVGGGRTLVNDDWRATVDGLQLLVGRASHQASSTLRLPITLVESLGVLLSNVGEITE